MVDAGNWALVRGGLCLFGDDARPVPVRSLWWTVTPVTPQHLGRSEESARLPVACVTQAEAAAAAALLGGRLPRSSEWEWMAAGAARRRYPWGDDGWRPGRAVLLPSGFCCPVAAGSHLEGATPEGVLDVAGNVWEWTATSVVGGGFVIRGGSYASRPLYARTTFRNAAPAELRSPGIGVRVVREP